MSTDDPFTPVELEAGAQALCDANDYEAWDETYPLIPAGRFAAAVLGAVAPLIAARVRAEERESIAQALEVEADAYNARIAAAAGVPNRDRDGMVSSGIRRAAAIARAHRTTPTEEPT